jgi:hypothetical protein
MAGVTLDFAGEPRVFHLRLGEILDVEEACGKVGIGAIYLRLARHEWKIRDIREVLTHALRGGGGMSLADARVLVDERINAGGASDLHALAIDVMLGFMSGVEPDRTQPAGDPEVPMDFGEIFAAFAQMGIAPEQVRKMRYADFCAMARAMGKGRVQPPSEDEFRDMVARYEAVHGKVQGAPA